MRIEFPKIVRSFPLSEYSGELKEEVFVWVNPTNTVLGGLANAFQKYYQERTPENLNDFLERLSVILSQGAEDTRFRPDELRELMDATMETDPAFWMWFNQKILNLIQEHRQGKKKV